jgi:hypothetical protein
MIIPNITREDMVEAGQYFNQESVIWGLKTEENKFVFDYIEGEQTLQRRDVVLFDDDVQSREDFYSQERQSAGRKFFIPFFDEEYEMEEGVEYDYDLPSLSETQREQNKNLIKEINYRIANTLDVNRTPKSRWHHRQVLLLRLQKLKKNL